MIKLIIFDLDGVLVDCKEIHYESLNKALAYIDRDYIISREEHLSRYDGLNTKKKLQMLSKEKDLPESYHDQIWKDKQKYTQELIEQMFYDTPMRLTLRKLKDEGYTIAVASNSIRQTLKLMLVKRGLMEFVDFFLSNEDVKNPKPSSEIYLHCMIKAQVSPKETLILEDSQHGRKAALSSGGNLMGVNSTADVTYSNIKSMIAHIQTDFTGDKWQDKKLNVLIPMAGAGSRFAKAGYSFPKPLIEVHNKPMIQVVTENLNIDAHFIYIVQKEHYDKYNLRTLLNLITPGCDIVAVAGITEGAACTTLLAKHHINNNNPLIIANSDQFLIWDSFDFMYSMVGDKADGGLVSFTATHPKWSFAKVDENGYVTEVAEKNPISNIATAGIYYWSSGKDYVKYAEQMIEKGIRTNGEFYVAPTLQEAIQDGKRIKNYHINEFYGIGTPEDLQYFLQNYKQPL